MSGSCRRIAMFGGSFNPIHAGHMALCRACQSAYGFDEFLLVPDNLPPHKSAREFVSNEDRMEMLRLAVNNLPAFQVSGIEYELGGTSYTVRTLRALRERNPGCRLYLLIGSDMLFFFREWRDWQGILELSQVIAAARHEAELDALADCRAGFGPLAERIELLSHTVVDVSSTRLREMLAQGENPGPLLPEGVYDYILRRGLYGAGDGADETIE